jgi:myo-inositol-1(or 4)-monophosphatase
MSPLINIGVKVARDAGDFIIKASQRLDLIEVTEKQKNDYVTDIDRQAEHMILDRIRYHYPSHGIIAEESGEISGYDEYTWIIDPLSGTKNFIHGIPHFAVSIAVKHKQQLIAAIIYDPSREELFTAERGRGARLNNTRLRVTAHAQLAGSLIGTGVTLNENRYPEYHQQLGAIFPCVADVRQMGSVALDLAYVAAGRIDGFWKMDLRLPEMAAGILCIREAGGLVVDIQGGEHYLSSGDVLTANPRLLKQLLKRLAGNNGLQQQESTLNN